MGVPVLLWVVRQGPSRLTELVPGLASAGLLTGLLSADLLLLQVVLLARIPWVERAWGHDVLVRRHGWLGFASFALIVTMPNSLLSCAAVLVVPELGVEHLVRASATTAAAAAARAMGLRYMSTASYRVGAAGLEVGRETVRRRQRARRAGRPCRAQGAARRRTARAVTCAKGAEERSRVRAR